MGELDVRFHDQELREKERKKKKENIWKRKSGKTSGEKNIYIAEMRNQKKEREEGLMEGKYLLCRRKKGEGDGGKYLDQENIFWRRKGGKYLEKKNFLRRRRRTEKENIMEEEKFMPHRSTGIKGSAKGPRRSTL